MNRINKWNALKQGFKVHQAINNIVNTKNISIYQFLLIRFVLCSLILYNVVYKYNNFNSNILNNISSIFFSIYNIIVSIINIIPRLINEIINNATNTQHSSLIPLFPWYDYKKHEISAINLYIFIHVYVFSMFLKLTVPNFNSTYIFKLTIDFCFMCSVLDLIG